MIARCQNGERQAQFELYQTHKDWVYNIAFRMTHHKQETEDICQTVFLHVFKKIHGFRGEAALSSWLYRIAVNTCINHLRKEKKRKAKIVQEFSDFNKNKIQENAGENEQFSLKPFLEKGIGALPQGYRMVFILHDIEGYNHKEIAEMMNIAEGTSKSQLHKARKELRQFLKPFVLMNQSI
ncbi:MAG: RNA polymerase sigma factor [bacterium]